MPTSTPTFSVLAPSRDMDPWALPLLRGLEAQTLPHDRFECVVTAGAGAATQAARRKLPFHLEVVTARAARSHAEALSIALRHSRGEIVVFTSGHVLPAPGWLEGFDAILRGGAVDVVAGFSAYVAAPADRAAALEAEGGPFEAAFARAAAHATPGHRAAPPFSELELSLRELVPRYPRSPFAALLLLGPNLAAPRALVEKAGGFPAAMDCAAELSLGLELWEAGARFGMTERAFACCLGDLSLSPERPGYSDVTSLFYRHPYTDVLRMALWLWGPGAPGPLAGLLEADPDPDALSERFRAAFKRPLAIECIHPREVIRERYEEMLGDAVTRGELDAYLDTARDAGVHARRGAETSLWDWDHTSNWITKRTPYHQALVSSGFGFSAETPLQRGDPEAAPARFHVRGRYEVEVPAALLAQVGEDAAITLPLPVEHPCQTEVRIVASSPEVMMEYIDRAAEFIEAFPLRLCEPGAPRVTFDFECVVREQTVNDAPVTEKVDEARHLTPTIPRARVEKASRLLDAILGERALDRRSSPLAIGRAIYAWILDNAPFKIANRGADFALECGLGSCLQRARLFADLCRLARIPARERSGAVTGRRLRGSGAHEAEQVMRGHSAFLHTWAELHDPGRGWVPVEFLGWSYGARALTDENVTDPELRREIVRRTPRYDAYYFGNVDPHRIRVAESATKRVTYPIGRANLSLDTLRRLRWDTRHRLRCTFSPR